MFFYALIFKTTEERLGYIVMFAQFYRITNKSRVFEQK